MKKISIILCLCMLFLCTACAPNEGANKEYAQINAFLAEGNYSEAYNAATDQNTKDGIIAENFVAYVCRELAVSVDTAGFSLKAGAFGKVSADEEDVYTPNDPTFAMKNYQKLAEYMKWITGKDFVNEYYYGVIELETEDTTWNILYSIKMDGCGIQLVDMWENLNMTSQDNNTIAFYKYLARKVMDEGTKLTSEAINRVGDKFLSGDAEQVRFQYDLT